MANRKQSRCNRPARVCFVLDCLGVAGIECQLQLLLKHLDRDQVEPYLCLLRGGDSHSQLVAELDGRPVLRLGIGSLLRPATAAKAWRFARYLRHERIDVLHPLFPDSLYFCAPIARLTGIPCVRFRVDIGYWMELRDIWLGRILSRMVDATVANCEACQKIVVDREWSAPESVAIIPNGVDLSRFADTVPSVPADFDRPVTRVGIVANLRRVKNLTLLIRAAAHLKAAHPGVQFHVAGEGECRKELEALIQELDLEDRFRLLGSVTDIPAFLRTLDVAVLCSASEGLPNSIMEYMAAGLPLITTDVGGCREIVQHEQNGLLIPPGDVLQLAGAIDRLVRDRELAGRLGANARQKAFAEFGVDTQALRYERFYRDLLLAKAGLPSGPSAQHQADTLAPQASRNLR